MNRPTGNLTKDLVAHLRGQAHPWVAFTEMPLGAVTLQPGLQRADVLAFKKSFALINVTIYEIKTSVADFRGDVTRDKWRGYLPFCHRLFFATPAGLVPRAEIPAEAGLIVSNREKGWSVVKAAPRHEWDLSPEQMRQLLLACLFRGFDEAAETRRLQDRVDLRQNVALSKRAKRLGWQIAQKLSNTEADRKKVRERIREALDLINGATGQKSHNLQEAVWALERWLEARLPGVEHIDTAVALVQVARDLVHSRNGTLPQWGAVQQIRDFVQKQEETHGRTT